MIQTPEDTNVTINGVRVQLVVNAATHRAQHGVEGPFDDLSEDERAIAKRAAAFLNKMRSGGYARESIRSAFWGRVLQEAQRVKQQPEKRE